MRATRPSDVYRLPDEPRRPSAAQPEKPPPPRRRLPLWVGVAGLLAVVLVLSGLVRSSGSTTTGQAPIVDIVSEDQAIAALALHAAQASVVEDLKARQDIYANPGPGAAAARARRGVGATQKALDTARDIPGADRLAADYYRAAEHPQFIAGLARVRAEAGVIALLAATHDTLYSGSGTIAVQDAYDQIAGTFAGTRWARPLTQWANALMEQMEDRDRLAEANAGRQAAGELWRIRVGALEPAAVDELREYIHGLPAVTVEALRGHPVAGPGLDHLERDRRQVSQRVSQ